MNHQSWSIKNWCFWQPLISCKMPPPFRTRIKRKTLSTHTPLPKRSALMPEALGELFAGFRWDISMGISGTDLLEVPTTFLRPLFQAYVVQYLHFRILKFPLKISMVNRLTTDVHHGESFVANNGLSLGKCNELGYESWDKSRKTWDIYGIPWG